MASYIKYSIYICAENINTKKHIKMARTVDYNLKAEKIKNQVDELVKELIAAKNAPAAKSKTKISDIDLDNEDLKSLLQLQARITRLIIEKTANQ